MRKSILSVVIITTCLGLVLVSKGKEKKEKFKEGFGYAEGIGDDEDADARNAYEWKLLHDPATGRIPDNIRMKELAYASTLPSDASLARGTSSSLVFQSRGPWNVGGRTRALGIDISNANNVIAGTTSGGMWRSTDGGNTWHSTTPINNYQSVSCLSQDTRRGHSNVWYYGSGEAYGASASATGAYYLGNGVFKSTDSGETWTVVSGSAVSGVVSFNKWSQLVWNIATDPSDTVRDVVYAASYGSIYRSTNGGVTWDSVLGVFGTSTSSYFTDVAVTKSGVVYATMSSDGANKGIYRSADGVHYTNITPAGFPINYNRVKIGISPSNEEQVYFLANTPGAGMPDTNYLGSVEWNSLWRYTYISGTGADTGGAWINRSSNLPMIGGVFNKFTCQGSYDLVVKVKPDDTNTVFIGGTCLYRSTNGFKDTTHTSYIGGYVWGATLPVVMQYANHHPDQHELVFYPNDPNKMISGNDGGLFMTNNNMATSVSWNSLNNGYLTSMFYTCAIDHATSSDIIIGGAQDNGSWYTNNTTLTSPWVSPRGGDGSYCAIADSQKAYYFSIQSGRVMRAKLNSTGGIDSFARIDPIGGGAYQFINPFVLDPNDNNIMYMLAGTHIWRNDNLSGIPYAGNWDTIATNWYKIPDSVTGSGALSAIAVSKTPANRVYVGTDYRGVFRYDSANLTAPHKVRINPVSGSVIFPAQGNVSCIAVDPTDGNKLLVVFSNYNVYSLFYSADAGATWKKVAGNLEEFSSGAGSGPSLRWAKIMPVRDGMVYLVGTSVGLFGATMLNDTSTRWVQLGANSIGSNIVDQIDCRESDGLVVVATHGHGIFSTHITSTSEVDRIVEATQSRQDLNLVCYPNPSRGDFSVSFNLTQSATVQITLLDELGRTVKTIEPQQLAPGTHELPVHTDFVPGNYYCRVVTKTQTETRKIVITH